MAMILCDAFEFAVGLCTTASSVGVTDPYQTF